jgi:hypothetical protein
MRIDFATGTPRRLQLPGVDICVADRGGVGERFWIGGKRPDELEGSWPAVRGDWLYRESALTRNASGSAAGARISADRAGRSSAAGNR